MFSRSLVMSATALIVAALGACGGKAPELGPALTGQFLDGPVQGLGFRTATESGTTDAQGRFRYRAGESVTFFIGDLPLPAVQAAPVVTPLEVAGSDKLEDAPVVNLLVLLQSLDQNSDPEDGIQISQATVSASSGAPARALGSALVAQPAGTFRTTLAASQVLGARPVVDEADAVRHFAKTLMLSVPGRTFETDAVVVARVLTLASDGTEVDPGVNRPTRIRFEGRNLHSGLVPEASGKCDAVVPIGDALETRLDFGCTPSAVGPLTVALKDADVVVGTYEGTVKEPLVLMRTSLGDLTIELNTTKAPLTAQNFLAYVDAGYYSNTVFHRVISNFMVQGGGCIVGETEVLNGGCAAIASTLRLKGNTFPAIDLERTDATGLSNVTGTLAMARTNLAKSATSQFFINVVDNEFLNATPDTTTPDKAGYAVFGRVVQGADSTLQAIRSVQVKSNGSEPSPSLPLTPPVILSATRVR